jgi:hypothetical protein
VQNVLFKPSPPAANEKSLASRICLLKAKKMMTKVMRIDSAAPIDFVMIMLLASVLKKVVRTPFRFIKYPGNIFTNNSQAEKLYASQ